MNNTIMQSVFTNHHVREEKVVDEMEALRKAKSIAIIANGAQGVHLAGISLLSFQYLYFFTYFIISLYCLRISDVCIER